MKRTGEVWWQDQYLRSMSALPGMSLSTTSKSKLLEFLAIYRCSSLSERQSLAAPFPNGFSKENLHLFLQKILLDSPWLNLGIPLALSIYLVISLDTVASWIW
jgi:hypothetical protein